MCKVYNRISELCEARNITGYRLCKDCGLSPSIITDLKMGRKKTLSAENAMKIAGYFNVSVNYLLGEDEEAIPQSETEELLEYYRNREDMRMLFKLAKGATPEDIRTAATIIEALIKKDEADG